MDLLADIDPVYTVLVVHLRHGYGVDTTHHNTRQGQQDLCNGIDSLALDPGRLAFQIVIDREKAGVRPGVSADPLVAGSDSNASNERRSWLTYSKAKRNRPEKQTIKGREICYIIKYW